MFLRAILFCLVALALGSCQQPDPRKPGKKKPEKPEKPMADVSGDVSYQAFLGRLRKAAAAHDVPVIASMMTPDFGYRIEPPGEGEGVFQYWEENGLWPELNLVLGERFVPNGNYMVAPPQFAADADYHGYRAGLQQVNGSWKFAYFVTD